MAKRKWLVSCSKWRAGPLGLVYFGYTRYIRDKATRLGITESQIILFDGSKEKCWVIVKLYFKLSAIARD